MSKIEELTNKLYKEFLSELLKRKEELKSLPYYEVDKIIGKITGHDVEIWPVIYIDWCHHTGHSWTGDNDSRWCRLMVWGKKYSSTERIVGWLSKDEMRKIEEKIEETFDFEKALPLIKEALKVIAKNKARRLIEEKKEKNNKVDLSIHL